MKTCKNCHNLKTKERIIEDPRDHWNDKKILSFSCLKFNINLSNPNKSKCNSFLSKNDLLKEIGFIKID